jgi:16S rRNA (uracil1498-N3)-methyltransferase
MQRYFLPFLNAPLSQQDQKHIIKVMRMRTDDFIIVCDQNCHEARITIDSNSVTYEKIKALPKKEVVPITLVQALLKGSKIETTVKYATMLGVKDIILVPMHYSELKSMNDHKMARLGLIIKEAAELSHRDELPKIKVMHHLKEIKILKHTYLLDELETHQIIPKFNTPLMLIVGPEGGIHSSEREFLVENNVVPTSLGPLILSAEFAGVAAISKWIQFP